MMKTMKCMWAAVLAVFDATYGYQTTKPKATGRQLQKVRISVPDAASARSAAATAGRPAALKPFGASAAAIAGMASFTPQR